MIMEFEVNTAPPSLNQFYAGGHWTKRTKAKSEYFDLFDEHFKFVDFKLKTLQIRVEKNNRFDVDNSIIAIKFLADYLKANGYIKDDTPAIFNKLSIKQNNELPKGTFKFIINGMLE